MNQFIRILKWVLGALVVLLVIAFLCKGASWVADQRGSYSWDQKTTTIAPAPAPTPVVEVKVITVTVTIPVTSTAGSSVSVVPVAAAEGVCPEKAIRTEPQGVLQADRSFIAQLGNTGCNTVFEGRVWEAGKGIQNRHDIVLINGAKDGFRYWEGNGWLLPSGWDVKEIACKLWEGKKTNWISQGITPLPVQFWGFDSAPNCQATSLPVPTATVVSITVQANSSQSIQVTPLGVLDWAKVLVGVPADRLEACPGEDTSKCVHVKDGQLLSVSVSAGYKYEGWDGSKVVQGDGPMTVKVSGLTVRPR